ncbi:MAG: iron-sulfur cluster assembly scaffold protein [Gemmatimonadales bacterium]|jgi:nitrogen fixation NifU-like protein
MDRETAIAFLVDHYQNPRHKSRLADADIEMPGGNPGCGDVVVLQLKADANGERIVEAAFEGRGCTISQAAASILLQRVNRERPAFRDVLALSYEEMIEVLGPELVGFRHRCATLALGTLKVAVKTLETDRKLRDAGYSAEEIARLRAATTVREPGLVVGAGAEAAARRTGV